MSDYNDGILPEPCLRMDTHFGNEYESVEFGDGTGYIKATPILAKVGALHEEIDRLRDESAELRELLQRLLAEYRYLRVRPRKMYLQHEARMRAIEEEMRKLGIEVDV